MHGFVYIGVTCGEFSKLPNSRLKLTHKNRKGTKGKKKQWQHNKSLNFNVEKVFSFFSSNPKRGFCAMRTKVSS